jgi:hypothetical protein
MSDPNIQRDNTDSRGLSKKLPSVSSNGKPVTARATQRQVVQRQAASLGIDTKGASTKELKSAVAEKQEAQKDLADFIKGVINDLPKNTMSLKNGGSPEVVSRKSEDNPSSFINSSKASQGNNSPQKNLPEIEFYCWKEGVVGTISIPSRDFSPLE